MSFFFLGGQSEKMVLTGTQKVNELYFTSKLHSLTFKGYEFLRFQFDCHALVLFSGFSLSEDVSSSELLSMSLRSSFDTYKKNK